MTIAKNNSEFKHMLKDKTTQTKKIYHGLKSVTVPTEEIEQMKLVDFLRVKRIPHFHVANERMASVAFRKKLKALGSYSGVPDMVVFLPSLILFIELKRAKKSLSKVSDTQKSWIETINFYDYAKAVVCYGASEAIEIIRNCKELTREHIMQKLQAWAEENGYKIVKVN